MLERESSSTEQGQEGDEEEESEEGRGEQEGAQEQQGKEMTDVENMYVKADKLFWVASVGFSC